MKRSYIIGIDEVGRGPLAGPVVVAAVLLPAGLRLRDKAAGPLRDSKQLAESAREHWDAFARQHPKIDFAIARVQPKTIEKINISRAANRAALRAYQQLLKQRSSLKHANCYIYLDGGLYLGDAKKPLSLRHRTKTVIKGDEKIPAIALASIIAKVHRDGIMTRLAKKYPEYGFEQHKGYGTPAHLAALARWGASEVHRLTFLKKQPILLTTR